jgi:hypothetical protein
MAGHLIYEEIFYIFIESILLRIIEKIIEEFKKKIIISKLLVIEDHKQDPLYL